MKLAKVALAIAGLAVVAQAAPHWIKLVRTADGDNVYVDVNSWRLSPNRSDAKVWVKFIKSDDSYLLSHFELDRDAKMFRVLASVAYAADGGLLDSDNKARGWIDIPPESIADMLYDLAFSEE